MSLYREIGGVRVAVWALGFLLLCGLAQAQPHSRAERLSTLSHDPPCSLAFQVFPSDARLYYSDNRPVSATLDGRYELERPRSNLGISDRVDCEFRKPGYASSPLHLRWADVRRFSHNSGSRYPLPVRLQPQSLGAYWETYRFPVGVLGLVLAVVISLVSPGWRRSRRNLKLAARLEGLLEGADRRADPLLGCALGDFRLIKKLGAGGMATVYVAYPGQDLDSKRAVAVKVVRCQHQDSDFFARFEREIAISARLDHPNIIRVMDWGQQENFSYLVMEFIDGKPLSQMVPPGGLSLKEAKGYLEPWFSALIYAHGRGVCHRDLKPENVMVSKTGRVILMDFGLARNHQVPTLTLAGSALGTPTYMAPEQIRGEDCGEAADQYSMGVSAYELLCGRPPFENPEPFALLRQHLQSPAPSIRQFRADLSQEVDSVLQRMLAKQPEGRFEDVAAAASALLAALSSEPEPPGRRPPPPGRGGHPSQPG